MITETDIKRFEKTFDYLKQVPYDICKETLYTALELYNGYNPDNADSFKTCFDTKVYNHYISTGKIDTIERSALCSCKHSFPVCSHFFHPAFQRNTSLYSGNC